MPALLHLSICTRQTADDIGIDLLVFGSQSGRDTAACVWPSLLHGWLGKQKSSVGHAARHFAQNEQRRFACSTWQLGRGRSRRATTDTPVYRTAVHWQTKKDLTKFPLARTRHFALERYTLHSVRCWGCFFESEKQAYMRFPPARPR